MFELNVPIPISSSNIDWKTISNVTKQVLQNDVTGGLTKANIDIKDIGAFLTIIPMDGDPKQVKDNIQNETHLLKHQHVTFMLVCDRLTLKELQLYTAATISYNIGADDDNFLVILTATIYDWVQSIKNLCIHNRSKNTRLVGNRLFHIFNTSNVLKKLFTDWVLITQADATFIIK